MSGREQPGAGTSREARAWPREYPARPLVGVGAIVVRSGRVLLVRRRFEPLKDRWSLPGGLVEVGESVADAVRREAREETGLDVQVGPLVEVVERLTRDPDGRVRYHYVLLDYLCAVVDGEAQASSDAADVAWAAIGDLDAYGVAAATVDVIARGVAMAG